MEKIYLERVDSTNKWAKAHIKELKDKTLVYTYNQTAGRGRLNRTWNNTGSDNIYASIVLKPSEIMKDVYSNLTQYLCIILAETMEEYNVAPKIKWPNDIQINGKKISGILAEGVNTEVGVNIEVNKNTHYEQKLEGIVLGFGVNLNTSKEILEKIDQPATSLNIETNITIDKEIFLQKVLDKFCLLYDKFIEEGFLLIKEDYIKRASFLNKEVSVRVFDKVLTGKAIDITDNGALKIVDKHNKEQILFIGDIL